MAISTIFAVLLVAGIGVTSHIASSACSSILIASSNEKSGLLADLAQQYSVSHAGGPGCRPAVTVERVPSGTAERELLAGWPGSGRPDVWAPQASTWVLLLQYQLTAAGGRQIVPNGPWQSMANSPLVVAMPRQMASTLGWPQTQPSWRELLGLAADPRGWAQVGQPGWGAFRLGKTDPETSTSGMHALIAAYYAATHRSSELTQADVESPSTRAFVGGIEAAVSHYADTADTFLRNLSAADDAAQALSYVSAVTIEEQELWAYNQGWYHTGKIPPHVTLAAIYPSDGTLVADHPYLTLNAPWVDGGKRAVAAAFIQWLLLPGQQARFADQGFRTSDRTAALPLSADPGILRAEPNLVLQLPGAAVIAAIQGSWIQLRKRVRLLILLDVDQPSALAATAKAVHDELSMDDVVEVWSVAPKVSGAPYRDLLPPTTVAVGGKQIQDAINGAAVVAGPTALYAATASAFGDVLAAPDRSRINAVMLIAGGRDDESGPSLADLERQLRPAAAGILVRVYAVAFPGADQAALQGIALASGGYFSQGAPDTAVREALANT